MFGITAKKFRSLLESMADGIYAVDPDQRVTYWNRGAEKLTGIAAETVVGTSLDRSAIAYEDEAGNALKPFEYAAALCLQNRKEVSRTLQITAANGDKIIVEEKASPLYERETLKGAVVTVRDMRACISATEKRLKAEKKERLIPICGWCKKIRSDDDYWEQLETYLTNEGFGIFTHGMCPSCADKIFEKKVYLESYQNICKAISASISLDEVLRLITTNVVKVMNVKASSLRLLNRETQQLEMTAYYGLSEKYAQKGPVSYDASIDDALAGRSVSVYDVEEHRDATYYKEAKEEGIRIILSIPLRYEKNVIGVLRMYSPEPVKYTDEDLKFISAIAEQAAIAIVNARRFEKAVTREKEYLRVFEEITKAVSSTLNLKELLDMITRKIPQVMGIKGCSLRLLDTETRQLELASYFGLSEKYANKGPVSSDASIDDALAGKPVSQYDIAEHKDSRYYAEAVEEGIRSILSIPMFFQKKVIGVLRLYTSVPVKHKSEDLRFMSAIAEQTAMAIVNAQYFETEISKEKEYLRVFEEVTKVISSTLNVNEVLDLIVQKIPEVMNLKAATVRLLDPAEEKLTLVASYGLSEKYLNKGPIDAEKNVIEALKENPVAIHDVATDSRIQYRNEAEEEGIKSMLTVPVVARGKVLGVLRLLTGEQREFSEQEVGFVASLAEQCGTAIENASLYEKTKKDYDAIMKNIEGAICKLK